MKKEVTILFIGFVFIFLTICVSQNENNYMKPSDSKPATSTPSSEIYS